MTECLETCKLALERGLITNVEYDAVKGAFVKAQQIKAGLDAGLLQQNDYERVKTAYLNSLLDSLTGGRSAGGAHPTVAVASSPASHAAANGLSAAPSPITATVPPSPAPASRSFAEEPTARAAVPVASSPERPAAAAPAAAVPAAPAGNGTVPVPTNIPQLGGQKNAQNAGVSLCGITISSDAVNLYYHMKAKAQYRWAMWKIDGAGKSVVIAAVGDKESTFDQFLSNLPPNDCRYAVYDYPYINSEGVRFSKIVFFNWAPETAVTRAKMMYASTKDHFKTMMEGISVEFQAGELDEIQESEVRQSVSALVVRK